MGIRRDPPHDELMRHFNASMQTSSTELFRDWETFLKTLPVREGTMQAASTICKLPFKSFYGVKSELMLRLWRRSSKVLRRSKMN